MMRVLLVSKFLHHVGGVETYLAWLTNALQERGHEVAIVGMRPPAGQRHMAFGSAAIFEAPTRTFVGDSFAVRSSSALNSVYSRASSTVVARALHEFEPDVVHYHGTCYQLTSSVVRASANLGIKRVATAHEYKLICANQRLWNDATSEVCTACVGASRARRFVNPVVRSCIKGSTVASVIGGVEAVVSSSVWRQSSDIEIHAPSRFMARMLRQDGWDEERVTVVDLPWPAQPLASRTGGSDLLYMGRLAVEKDVATLLEGWRRAEQFTGTRELLIAGDGTSEGELRGIVADRGIPRVKFLGRVDGSQLQVLLRSVAATVHPAAWFENSPFAVRESLMAGVPALVANTGGMPELIRPGITGVLVEHSPSGWMEALCEFAESGPRAGSEVLDVVHGYRTSERSHLAAMLRLYGQQ